jgi:hypothetical protein
MRGKSPEGAFMGPPRAFCRCGGFFILVLNQAKLKPLWKNSKSGRFSQKEKTILLTLLQ